MCTVGAVPFQAAAAAGKPYVWAIDGISDDASGMLFGQLLAVVNGCIEPELTRRLTVSHVLESLMTLQRDVTVAAAAPSAGAGGSSAAEPGGSAAGAGVSVAGAGSSVARAGGSVAGGAAAGAAGVPPPSVPATPAYDVLAIVSAMEALGIDTAAVIDAIGGMSTSSLEAQCAAGVSLAECIAVRDALASVDGTPAPTKVIVALLTVASLVCVEELCCVVLRVAPAGVNVDVVLLVWL